MAKTRFEAFFKWFYNEKGQVSIEYLLIIGGAIAVVALALFVGYRVLQKQGTLQESRGEEGLGRLVQ